MENNRYLFFRSVPIWSWCLRIALCVMVCVLCVFNIGSISAIRIALVTGYVVCIFVVQSQKGPKLEGSVSCVCILLLHLTFPIFRMTCGQYLSLLENFFREAALLLFFLSWAICAVLSIKKWQYPNCVLGFLSIVSIISPGVLTYFFHIKYIILSALGYVLE
jgi:hypothetical protein